MKNASVDGLTGALNRKAAEQKSIRLCRIKSVKVTCLCSILMILKTGNDTMGHAIGDLALITLVKLLKEHFP